MKKVSLKIYASLMVLIPVTLGVFFLVGIIPQTLVAALVIILLTVLGVSAAISVLFQIVEKDLADDIRKHKKELSDNMRVEKVDGQVIFSYKEKSAY